MTEREAFEAWAAPRHIELTRDMDWPDKYRNDYVQSMWKGWQASAAARDKRYEAVVEAVRSMVNEWNGCDCDDCTGGQMLTLRQALAALDGAE